MKYNLFFLIIIYFFILAQASNAMEKQENKLILFKEITAIKNPNAVKYLTDDSVVIGGQGCSIVNFLTNEERKISNFDCSYVAIHPNKKKIAFSHDKTIELYNIETNKPEWVSEEKYPINSFGFSPCGDTLFLCLAENFEGSHLITKCNYLKNNCSDDDIRNLNYPVIALHPKEHIMCMVEMWGNVFIYQSSDLTLRPKVRRLIHPGSYCQVSPNGFIAVVDPDGIVISIIDSNMDSRVHPRIESEENEMFIRMLFYSRGLVLATSSLLRGTKKHIMRYWDVKTLQLIHTTQPLKFGWDYDFSFSPDGKEVIIAFEKKCLIFPVPFKVQYEPGTKEKFPYLLFFLKNYIAQQHWEIPEDVTRLLTYTLLKTFRRIYEI